MKKKRFGFQPFGLWLVLEKQKLDFAVKEAEARFVREEASLQAKHDRAVAQLETRIQREEAALAALRYFGEQNKKRKRLTVLLSVAGVSAAIATHVGVSAGMGSLDEYSDVAGGFALISAAMLFFPFYSLLFDDPHALLYKKYQRTRS